MITKNELAAFSLNAYRPSEQNLIQVPNWTRNEELSRPNRGFGFDGSVFVKGSQSSPTEIVIAFRGTDGDQLLAGGADFLFANIDAARGDRSAQVLRAIELVADTMATYPGVPFTLTGHCPWWGVGLTHGHRLCFSRSLFRHRTVPAQRGRNRGPFTTSADGSAAPPGAGSKFRRF